MLEVRLIGAFELKCNGKPVSLPSRPAQSLLAYLLLNAGTTHRREKLAGMFWPDSTDERARASLRYELWRIRKSLTCDAEGEILRADELTIGIDENASYRLDVRDVLQVGPDATVADLMSALAAYSGELLPGFYDDWAVSERGRLQIHFEQRLTRLLELLEAAQRWPEMVDWAERWLALGAASETAYRYLILGHAAQGDRVKAQETYERCVRALDALGLVPSAELRSLAEAPGLPAAAAHAPARPSGTVTFLFTDIENSTKLAQTYRQNWEALRSRHHAIMRAALEANNGYVFEIIGDAFCAAFHRPADAVLAAIAAQRALYTEDWGSASVRVRMGIHTGVAEPAGTGYRGYLTLSSVQRVMSAAHGGQIIVSQSAYDLLEGDLPDDTTLRDMGEHRLKDLLRRQHLYQVVLPDLPADFPPLRSLDVQPHNLPVQLTAFIGREQELAEIVELLEHSRLVTLTGLAGTGKTRLSLQVAAEVLERFADGAWFVELAPLTDPLLVPQSIAAALKIREQPGRTALDTLKDSLAGRSLLLILDNCEHLIEAAAQAADELLSAAPNLRILATSRENLGVAGGAAYAVSSLPLPDATASTVEAISHSDAVRLFIDRAGAVQPALRISDQNAQTVAQICQRLDGIPLALELAAARAAGMTLEQIALRLDDRFHLLTSGSRTAPNRQRTLRATIDWSHDLLSELERTLFRRLAVFVGGWTPEAARAITAGGVLKEREVEDVLSNLVEKSLVVLDLSSGRYRMLETVREYALERLTDAGEEPDLRNRHLDHWVAAVNAPEVQAAQHESALAHLADDQENILSAVAWCDEAEGGAQKALQIMGATRFYWGFNGRLESGFRLCLHVLALPGAQTRNLARCRALSAMGHMGFHAGHAADLVPGVEESLAIARELGDARGIAEALHLLGNVSAEIGNYDAALQYLQDAYPFASELQDGGLAGIVLNDLGEILRATGNFEAAEAKYERALALGRKSSDLATTFWPLVNLGMVAVQRGDLARARSWLKEALALYRTSPDKLASVSGLVLSFAGTLAAMGEASRAARFYGAAEEQSERGGEPTAFSDRVFITPLMERARQELGIAEFEKLVAAGRLQPIAAVLDEAEIWLRAEK